ncbi:nucleolar RNA helicase 2 [Pelomyxa schiedti]|nr:nucleolar RNA helicase 2 [Pelomyxa schiedti]
MEGLEPVRKRPRGETSVLPNTTSSTASSGRSKHIVFNDEGLATVAKHEDFVADPEEYVEGTTADESASSGRRGQRDAAAERPPPRSERPSAKPERRKQKRGRKIANGAAVQCVDNGFSKLGLLPDLVNMLAARGINDPFPIQEALFSYVLAGKDVVGQSKTGSGKTLAFILPVLHTIFENPPEVLEESLPGSETCNEDSNEVEQEDHSLPPEDFVGEELDFSASGIDFSKLVPTESPSTTTTGLSGGSGSSSAKAGGAGWQRKKSSTPLVICLEPTRELAEQTTEEFEKCSLGKLLTCPVFGGVPSDLQYKFLCLGVDIVVGTPGRIIELAELEVLRYDRVKFVIHILLVIQQLDEADKILEPIHAYEIELLLSQLKDIPHQTLLFSATFGQWAQNVAQQFLSPDFVVVNLVETQEVKLPVTVTHLSLFCEEQFRVQVIQRLLKFYGKSQTLLFCNSVESAKSYASALGKISRVLHAELSQTKRDERLQGFRKGEFSVLVATELAGRGLDIPTVDLIIMAAPPLSTVQYIHRAGRTGRAGAEGTSIVLFYHEDIPSMRNIEKEAGIKFTRISVPNEERLIDLQTERAMKKLVSPTDHMSTLFLDQASLLINTGKPAEYLSRVLALLSGATPHTPTRINTNTTTPHSLSASFSLLDARPGFTTLKIRLRRGLKYTSTRHLAPILWEIVDDLSVFGLVAVINRNIVIADVTSTIADIVTSQSYHPKGAITSVEIAQSIPQEYADVITFGWSKRTNSGDYRKIKE